MYLSLDSCHTSPAEYSILRSSQTNFDSTCAQAAKRAMEAGGHIVKDKFSIGDYGNIALVSDPDGNVVGFHSMA